MCFPPLTRERRAVDIFILFLNKPFFHNVESTFKNSATYIDRHDKGRHFYSFCKNDIICLHDDGFKKIKNYVIIAFDNRYLFCLDKAGYVTMKSDNSFVSILLKNKKIMTIPKACVTPSCSLEGPSKLLNAFA